nr:tumor necrosis factor ligand superfamily member 18-like isoform X1 [Pogona vitticeps]XP_020668828.1 tumor necrosis factor ligand superfamily member 18-like isoform X2 [Pogona vitticeps]
MEGLDWKEGAHLHREANKPRKTLMITLWLVACLVILALVLFSFLIACFLLHHKQTPKTCWFHGSSPIKSRDAINWTWRKNCTGSVKNEGNSSLEILENGMYFIYVYVAHKENPSTRDYFTVVLLDDSDTTLSLLKGPSIMRAFVNMGRPYFLEKGQKLHLDINVGLTNIATNETYWGLFKI